MKFFILCLLVAGALAAPYRKLVRTPKGGGSIVGGSDASAGQFPYQLSFQDVSFGLKFHFCGASLYSTTWAVCAGHCVQGENYEDPRNLDIVAGELDLSTDSGDEQRQHVIRIILHEGFNICSVNMAFNCDDPCNSEASIWKQLKESICRSKHDNNYKQLIDMAIDATAYEKKKVGEDQNLVTIVKQVQELDQETSDIKKQLSEINQKLIDTNITKCNLLEIQDCQDQKIGNLENQACEMKQDSEKIKQKGDEIANELQKQVKAHECRKAQLICDTRELKAKLQRKHECLVTECRKKNATQVKVDALDYNVSKAEDNIIQLELKDKLLNQELHAAKSEFQAAKKQTDSQRKEYDEIREGMECLCQKLADVTMAETNLKVVIDKTEQNYQNLQNENYKNKQDIKKLKPTLKLLEREMLRVTYDIDLAERELEKQNEMMNKCRKCGLSINNQMTC